MKAKHRKREQILRYLRDIETMTQAGKSGEEACRHFDVATQAYYSWRKKYGQMKSDELVRLDELEIENKRLKKLMAEKDLQIDVLKEAAKGRMKPRLSIALKVYSPPTGRALPDRRPAACIRLLPLAHSPEPQD